MPSITNISSWFKYSQIEYFTPFMKLWLAFNSWYRNFLPNLRTNREVVDSIKNGSPLKDNFISRLEIESDESNELRESLAILVNELRIQKISDGSGGLWGFDKSDIKPDFRNLNNNVKSRLLNSGNCIKLNEETIVTSDKSIFFQETFEIIYLIRCSLIHGDFDVDNRRAQRLVKSAFIVLSNIFGPIVSNQDD